MNIKLLFRSWFYFRSGYGQYFSFAIALVNMFTITYYLFIEKTTFFADLFPNFSTYVVVSSVIGIPSLVIIGYIHIRRSHAYKSEIDIGVEANPYNYQLVPGIMTECHAPLYLELLRMGRKSLSGDDLDTKELESLDILMSKLKLLSDGGSLDVPKKFNEM